jgi:hypothetical protein
MLVRCSLKDHIRDILYVAFQYQPEPQTNLQKQDRRAMETAVTTGLKFPCLTVAVDERFIQKYNICGNMKLVNKILYEAAGCGRLYR